MNGTVNDRRKSSSLPIRMGNNILPGEKIAAFQRGGFTIHLIGKRDIRVTGKGFTGEMRFYDAAKKVMELENEY